MGPRDKTLVIEGAPGGGKATLIGCMLFKYGGIDMLTMQSFQQEGIRTYEQAANNLKNLKIAPNFDTPKHHVTVHETSDGLADCTLLVVPADQPSENEGIPKGLLSNAKRVIIIINKMDTISWSEKEFQKIVEGLPMSTENIPIIPVSALHGDNVVDKSPKSSWYQGWKTSNQSGTTLLEALDALLQN